MTKLFKVANSSGKSKDIFANDETHAAELAILSGLGRKASSMKVKEYDKTKHTLRQQNNLIFLEYRNAIGEMKKNPITKFNNYDDDENIMDYDGIFVVFFIK